MNRRKFMAVGLGATSSLLSASYIFAQVNNLDDAINKSGRQRMLSQRLAKCYLQIGQAIDIDRSKIIFDASLALFDRQLAELKVFSPTQDNKSVLNNLEKTWISYKEALVGKAPNQQDAKLILKINEDVLIMAQESTAQLEKLSGTTTSKIVNLAGRQRMLSQRMAKCYQALNWGIAPSDTLPKLLTARKEFVDSLAVLTTYQKNTPEIKDKLELGKQQWIFFDNSISVGIGDAGKKTIFANNVATTSERILEVMDKVTDLYSRLG